MSDDNDTSRADAMKFLPFLIAPIVACTLGALTECTNDKPDTPAQTPASTPASAETAGRELGSIPSR